MICGGFFSFGVPGSRLLLVFALFTMALSAQADPIVHLETDWAGFVGMTSQGPVDQPIAVNSYNEFTQIFGSSTEGLANPYLVPSVAGYFANGGVHLVVVRINAIDNATVIGMDGGTPESRTGLQALRNVDEISMIAIPGVATAAVQTAMIAHCESLGDRMAILDPASADDFAAVQSQRAGLFTDGGFAALYFPWIEAAPIESTLLLPPSGFVAGSYSSHDPNDSPVGLIATASDVAYELTTEEHNILNAQNINAIRDLSGIRIWGARTLSENQEWQYITTRRMALSIEESIEEGTAWCLDEPNDEILWEILTEDMENFMFGLYVSGWFQGAMPSEAYFVRCDQSTMTEQDIAEGRTILFLGFAPLQPAEFVVMNIVHQRSDLSAVPAASSGILELALPAPNPFNPVTTFKFTLARDAKVDLLVIDRQVAWCALS